MSSGIVAKVWNIKGESITKGAKEQISDSISYILNDEKTEIKLDINTLDQLTRECKYVENDLKTFSGAYVGVHNVISSDIATAVGEMMNVKKFFGKTSGRAALHMMISLPEEESDVANAPRLMQLCQDVLKELFPDNQAIFAVHTNTDNLHIHIIVNSVGLNGKKIHQDNKYIKERLQPCVNKYAKWYNFTPNSEWSKKKSASAYPYVQLKMELRDAIDMAIEKADTFESFLNNLQEQGITARIGKHISLKIPGMSKAVRTHNLGPNYTRDAIVERIISKKEKLTLQTKEEYFALIKPDNVFEPVLFQMKKYKEMSDVEKKEVIHELKLGKNPWRENREMNWQLNKIANELNQFERIRSYVNPMDVNFEGVDYATLQEIIAEKTDFIITLLSSCMRRDIDSGEQGILDKVIDQVYSENYAMRKKLNGESGEVTEFSVPAYMQKDTTALPVITDMSAEEQERKYSPTLQDVYQKLKDMENDVTAQKLAAHMQIFVNGSLNLFNHKTNIDLNRKFLVFDISGIKENLRVTCMLVMLEIVKTKIKWNFARGNWTNVYIDEFHELLGVPAVADYVIKLWKEVGKLHGSMTGITQNMTDLINKSPNSDKLAAILSNTEYFAMLNQSTIDRRLLADFLPSISPAMFNFVEGASKGTGLLKMGPVTVPFDMRMSNECKLYQYVNTDGNNQDSAI